METIGFEKVRKQFNLLPLRVRDRVMSGAVRGAQTTFRNGLKHHAPKELGHLAANMQTKVKAQKNGSLIWSISGAAYKWIPVPKSVRWTKTGNVNPALIMNVSNKGIHAGKNVGWIEGVFRLLVGESQKRFETFLIRGIRREGTKLGMKAI